MTHRTTRQVAILATDALLIATTSAYARWLDRHKELEPDWTWLEVVLGNVLCLAHAAVCARLDPDTAHEGHTVRAFVLGGIPIIVGEVAQWAHRRGERRRYLACRQ